MALTLGRVTRQRDAQLGLPEGLAELGDDLGGCVLQAVEDAQQARIDVLAGRPPARRIVTGQPEDMITLVERQMQTLRDRRDHLFRRLRTRRALQP